MIVIKLIANSYKYHELSYTKEVEQNGKQYAPIKPKFRYGDIVVITSQLDNKNYKYSRYIIVEVLNNPIHTIGYKIVDIDIWNNSPREYAFSNRITVPEEIIQIDKMYQRDQTINKILTNE